MATKRSYGDGCAIARGLDLVGERWALLIVRELLLGPKRFTDLKRGLPNASPNVLSERLRELEQSGIIKRSKLPPPVGSHVYELTDWGRELEVIVVSLGRWASGSPSPPSGAPVGADSVALALRGLFDPVAANGLQASYELSLGDDRFRVDVGDGKIEVARGSNARADATIDTDPNTLNSVLWGNRSLAAAKRSHEIMIEGDQRVLKEFFRLFPIPNGQSIRT
jgi:DNA-binding HxlR family transcriptional regulator